MLLAFNNIFIVLKGFIDPKNLGIGSNIILLPALVIELSLLLEFDGHFGGHLAFEHMRAGGHFYFVKIEFLAPQNLGVDTKIIILSLIELEI